MAQILAIHSFRGGTGKSNLTANLATALAMKGKNIAVIDTDLASPGIHVLFGFTAATDQSTLNDHLQDDVPIINCAHDVTPDQVRHSRGRIWLVPGAMDSDRIARLLREGYEVEKLNDAIFSLSDKLSLDLVLPFQSVTFLRILGLQLTATGTIFRLRSQVSRSVWATWTKLGNLGLCSYP